MDAQVEAFRRSLTGAAPPQGASLALQALWWAGKGDWARAHHCAQEGEDVSAEDAACAWVHAHLHRVEGDHGNAGYWYCRAGQPAATDPLPAEWERIAAALLGAAGQWGGAV